MLYVWQSQIAVTIQAIWHPKYFSESQILDIELILLLESDFILFGL